MTDLSDKPGNTLRMTRDFGASPETMFEIWTRPEFLRIWFASSHGFEVETCDIDLRPGGSWRVCTRRRDVIEHPWGIYHDVLPARRLVYSYLYEGRVFHSTVSVDFELTAGGTRVRLCQTGFPDPVACEEHVKGWNFVLEILQQALISPSVLNSESAGTELTSLGRLKVVEENLRAARQRAEAEGRLVQPR